MGLLEEGATRSVRLNQIEVILVNIVSLRHQLLRFEHLALHGFFLQLALTLCFFVIVEFKVPDEIMNVVNLLSIVDYGSLFARLLPSGVRLCRFVH